MKREWDVHRIFNEQDDGQRRWDSAFQLLLRWAMAESSTQAVETLPRQEIQENASSDLCARIDHASKPNTNH